MRNQVNTNINMNIPGAGSGGNSNSVSRSTARQDMPVGIMQMNAINMNSINVNMNNIPPVELKERREATDCANSEFNRVKRAKLENERAKSARNGVVDEKAEKQLDRERANRASAAASRAKIVCYARELEKRTDRLERERNMYALSSEKAIKKLNSMREETRKLKDVLRKLWELKDPKTCSYLVDSNALFLLADKGSDKEEDTIEQPIDADAQGGNGNANSSYDGLGGDPHAHTGYATTPKKKRSTPSTGIGNSSSDLSRKQHVVPISISKGIAHRNQPTRQSHHPQPQPPPNNYYQPVLPPPSISISTATTATTAIAHRTAASPALVSAAPANHHAPLHSHSHSHAPPRLVPLGQVQHPQSQHPVPSTSPAPITPNTAALLGPLPGVPPPPSSVTVAVSTPTNSVGMYSTPRSIGMYSSASTPVTPVPYTTPQPTVAPYAYAAPTASGAIYNHSNHNHNRHPYVLAPPVPREPPLPRSLYANNTQQKQIIPPIQVLPPEEEERRRLQQLHHNQQQGR